MSSADFLALFGHFMLLSLLAVGGAISTAPDMHRYLVIEQHWINDAQFNASIAIAQAAPGPNVLFVAVLGWNVAGPLGALATMSGILIPSTVLSLWATRWGAQRRDTRGVRAFTTGMAPLTLGLLLATGWLLAEPARRSVGGVALVVVTVLVMLRSKLSPMWLVAAGAGGGRRAGLERRGDGIGALKGIARIHNKTNARNMQRIRHRRLLAPAAKTERLARARRLLTMPGTTVQLHVKLRMDAARIAIADTGR